MLPVTLRHVQAELRGSAARQRAGRGERRPVRVKRLQSDADILAWYAKLQKYHETQITAEELRPAEEASGSRPRTTPTPRAGRSSARSSAGSARARSRCCGNDADAKQLELPQLAGGDPRPFEVVGLPLEGPGYHVVEIESLRLGQVAARQARADVRAHRRARHQPRRALQARPREQRRLGDDARPRQAGRRRRDRGQRLLRQAALERAQRRAGPGGRCARALDASFDHCPPTAASSSPRARPTMPRQERRRDRRRLRLQQLAEGHRAVALQRADRARRASPTCAPRRCSTARCCAPARRWR